LSGNAYAARNFDRIQPLIEGRLRRGELPSDGTPLEIINSYLEKQRLFYPDYFSGVEKYAAAIEKMTGREKWVVLLPFAAFGDQCVDSLNLTLSNLNGLTGFGREEIETLCFGNKPQFVPDFDQTRELVSIWQKNGGYKINAFWGDIAAKKEKSQPRLGLIRKTLFDVALLRISQAFCNEGNELPYFYLCDDDVVKMSPTLLGRLFEYLASNKEVGLAIGPGSWENQAYPTAAFPDLLIGSLLMYKLGDFNRYILEKITAGKRSGLSKEQVAQINTFIYSLAFTKPLLVNMAMRAENCARFGNLDQEAYVNVLDVLARQTAYLPLGQSILNFAFLPLDPELTVLYDSRRALKAYFESNTPPVAQWRDAPPKVRDETRGLRFSRPIRGVIPIRALDKDQKSDLRFRIFEQTNRTLSEFTIPTIFKREFNGWCRKVLDEIFGSGNYSLLVQEVGLVTIWQIGKIEIDELLARLEKLQESLGQGEEVTSTEKVTTKGVLVFDNPPPSPFMAIDRLSASSSEAKKPEIIKFIPLPSIK